MVEAHLPDDVAISPDQRWAAAAGDEGLVIYDLTRITEPPRTLHHHSDLTATAFSPNGDTFATGSETGLAVLWSTKHWHPVGQIAAHGSDIRQLAFSPDGSGLVSAGGDGTIRLWDTARTRANITHDKTASVAPECAAAPNGT